MWPTASVSRGSVPCCWVSVHQLICLPVCLFVCTYVRDYLAPSSSTPEDDGRDLSCVVSSLVQLMVDPHFRSIPGFEALLQKDWVAMGYPFATRHGLIQDTLVYGSEEQLQEVCL